MTEKVELINSDIKPQGFDTTHTVRSLEMFKRKLKIENSSRKFLIGTGSSLNILNRKTFDKIKEESKGNLLLQKTNVKVIGYGKNQPSLQIKGVVTLLLESKSRITSPEINEIKIKRTGESPLKEIPTRLHIAINKYKESVFNGKIGKFKDFNDNNNSRYYGYSFSNEGMRPTPSKINALKEAK